MIQRLTTYLRDTRLEMRKVNWPSRTTTVRFTITVIVVSLGVAVTLGFFDFVFRQILIFFV